MHRAAILYNLSIFMSVCVLTYIGKLKTYSFQLYYRRLLFATGTCPHAKSDRNYDM